MRQAGTWKAGGGEAMAEELYFRRALSDFAYENASGGAIRHLTDLGYTAAQITERLTFPTPYERVRQAVWKRLLESGVVLLAEPGSGNRPEKAEYIEEYDRYGRSSYRRAVSGQTKEEPVRWREKRFTEEACGKLAAYLAEKCAGEGRDAYLSCEFGIWRADGNSRYGQALEILDRQQREYIEGLLWEKRICYHRLDDRMREIAVRLHKAGLYHGACYFVGRAEKLIL